MILQLKEQSPVRPAKWEDVFPYDQVVKSLWAQWEQVDFHRGVNKTRYYLLARVNFTCQEMGQDWS